MITFKEVCQQLDLEIVLRDLQPVDKGSYFILACPACGKREAYIYKGGRRIRCNRLNKCGYSANLWEYLQMRFHLSRSEAFGKLAELAGLNSENIGRHFEIHPYRFRRRYKVWRFEQGREPVAQPEVKKYLAEYQTALTDNSLAALYLNWRRIALEIAREYGLGYSPPKRWRHLKNGKPVRQWRHGHLIFPLENNRGELVNFQARALDTKGIARELRLSHDILPGSKGVFNARILQSARTVFLCEGVLDALTLAQTGVRNVIATIGLGGMYWHWFKTVENLVICFDIDAAGEREFRKIARDAGLSGMTVYRLPAEIYGGKKDLNDALRADVLNGVALFDFCERHGLQEKRKVSKSKMNILVQKLIETLDGEEVGLFPSLSVVEDP